VSELVFICLPPRPYEGRLPLRFCLRRAVAKVIGPKRMELLAAPSGAAQYHGSRPSYGVDGGRGRRLRRASLRPSPRSVVGRETQGYRPRRCGRSSLSRISGGPPCGPTHGSLRRARIRPTLPPCLGLPEEPRGAQGEAGSSHPRGAASRGHRDPPDRRAAEKLLHGCTAFGGGC